MTNHKRAEAYRLELAAEREKTAFLQEFIRKMSHDCRTPLTVINTNLYLLERSANSDSQKLYLAAIQKQAMQLETYIQNILAISRMESNPELAYETFDVNQMFKDIESDFHILAEQKNLCLTLNLFNALPPIRADQTELRHALTNLVENAVRYTPAGGTIFLQTGLQDNHIVMTVQDTGIGISLGELSLIFTPFYRTHRARQMDSNGTGLGLAIVKQIVNLHGGSIDVQSTPGEGSLFRIQFPISDKSSVS
jgi:two-component system, OmpR family, phosphate regulon sensor histidine kinase PhoR